MSSAILVIDMLNDFVTGKLKCDRAKNIIPNLKKLIEFAREKKVPVIYCNDSHLSVDGELKLWGPHAIRGTEGAQVISELKPDENDFIVNKRTYSAFFETGLDPLLRDLGVDTVIITGLHTNICDRHTAADAFFRGYKIVVAKDAVEAFTEKDQVEGLEYLKANYKASIKTVNEIIEGF